jgi:hypothetical protein
MSQFLTKNDQIFCRIFFLLIIIPILILASEGCNKKPEDLVGTNKPPVVTLITPLSGSQIHVFDTLKIVATASDPDGTVNSVYFYVNNILVFKDGSTPWEYSVPFNETGNVYITVIAIDDDGKMSSQESAMVEVIPVDQISVWFSLNPEYYSSYHLGDTITVTITANSPYGNITKTSFFVDNALFWESATLPYEFRWSPVTLGDHQLYATANDDKGKNGTSMISHVTVYPNLPPTVELNSPNSTNFHFRPGDSIHIYASPSDPEGRITKVEFWVDNTLINTQYGQIYFYDYYWKNASEGDHEIQVKAYDKIGQSGESAPLTITVLHGFKTNATISDLEASEDNALVFGLDQTHGKLLLLNPVTKTLDNTISLPHSEPLAMDYSKTDKKLYIVYKYDGVVTVWDKQTQTSSSLTFSGSDDGKDIKVDPVNRRIYVLTANNKLYVLNMDNGQVITPGVSFTGNVLGIDIPHRLLFSLGDTVFYGRRIYRYSVSGDSPLFLQKRDVSSYRNQLAVNSQAGMVVIPATLSRTAGATAIDVTNLNNILGQYDTGNYPQFCTFTADYSKILTINSDSYDPYIYVDNVATHTNLSKIYLPSGTEAAIAATDASSTKIVAAVNDDYYITNSFIYFLDMEGK